MTQFGLWYTWDDKPYCVTLSLEDAEFFMRVCLRLGLSQLEMLQTIVRERATVDGSTGPMLTCEEVLEHITTNDPARERQ